MATDFLNISIENLEKRPKVIINLLDKNVVITEKVDGTKLTLIRNEKPWSIDPTENWIVSFKGNVIYANEFKGINNERDHEIKTQSAGFSQYKFIWDWLKSVHHDLKEIPINTEFLFEFVMRKRTLTREYLDYHHLILIGYSPTKYVIKNGKVFSTPNGFTNSNIDKLAQLFEVYSPKILYKGKLKTIISNKNLASPEAIIANLKEKFLTVESQFGGKIEGIVLEFEDGSRFKLVQNDQYDTIVRTEIKKKFDPTNPTEYWNEINKLAHQYTENLNINDPLEKLFDELSKMIYNNENLKNIDPNRNLISIQDDLYLTAKSILLRRIPGNNGALIVGRFSPLTIAHYKIIKNALDNFDTVTVNIVKAKIDERNPFPVELQKKLIQLCFGDKIDIIESRTGLIPTILRKVKNNITTVLAGSDRVNEYRRQLERNNSIQVVEVPRTDEISGTLVRNALLNNDRETFDKFTPIEIHGLYDELRKYVLQINKKQEG